MPKLPNILDRMIDEKEGLVEFLCVMRKRRSSALGTKPDEFEFVSDNFKMVPFVILLGEI